MGLAELIAWIVFALIFAFIGMVLGATWKQIESEAHASGLVKHAEDRRQEKRPRP
jgi:hypothetical protein